MRTLVTGGAGFIGSHTVDMLRAAGHEVVVLDSLQPRVHPRGKPSWVPADVEFVQGDVSHRATMERAMEGCEAVFHLAAYQDYLPDFSTFIHTNAESAALIFELAVADRARFPLKKAVFASSQSVCGEGRHYCPRCGGKRAPSIPEQLADPRIVEELDARAIHVPAPRPLEQLKHAQWEIRCPRCAGEMRPVLIDEPTVAPGTTYAISKYTTELLAARLGARYGIATVCVRPTYVQGSRNSFYNAYSGIARRFALRIMHGLPPTIYEDGMQLRDYINVSDVARALVMVLDDPRADGQVFNVGGGRAVTVNEFAAIMLKEMGSDLAPLVNGDFRLGDTRHTVSDVSRLRALGWKPRVPVEESVREYVAWMREQTTTREFLDEAERVMREQGVVQASRAGGRGA